MNPFSCISRMPSSLVAPQTPACVVTGMPRSRATSNAAFSGKAGSPVTSKAICTPIRSSRVVAQPLQQRADGGVGGPLPRAGLDVAVGQDEPAGHRAQRVEGGLAVVDGVQVVRPVDRRGDAGVERLDGRQPVAGGDVLRAELLAVLEVVPDEVLGQRPVGAVAAHRRLPHVPVGVDHARASRCRRGRRSPGCPRARRAAGRRRRSGRRRRARRRRSGPSTRRPSSGPCRRGTPAGGRAPEPGVGVGHRLLLGRRRHGIGRLSAERSARSMAVTFERRVERAVKRSRARTAAVAR